MTIDNVTPEAFVAATRTPERWTTGAQALRQGLVLTGLAIWEALLLLWLCVCLVLSCLVVGLPLLAPAMAAMRTEARRQRRLACQFSHVSVTENYLPDPPLPSGRFAAVRRELARASDPATGKDLLWHLFNPLVGVGLAALPVALLLNGLFGMLMPLLWGPVVSHWDNSWYLFVPLGSFGATFVAFGLGAAFVVAAPLAAPTFVRTHARLVVLGLSTQTREQLRARVEHLSRSRTDAVEHEASEIRRIERDLHDGAQARLVAMGMTLTAAERLMGEQPDAARALVHEAKEASSAVLTELRELVRGIHPPVLADRGLVDAVRARGLQLPVPVSVSSTLVGRPTPPVESAIYFAASELLTNAVKHAEASAVTVHLSHDENELRVVVEDNGRGGASLEQEGTGLRGIEQRLLAFDGNLLVRSPIGGPTTMTIVIPARFDVSGSHR